MSRIVVRPIDVFDDGDVAALHAVRSAAIAHGRPDYRPISLEAAKAAWRADAGWVNDVVGVYDGDELVAVASTQSPTTDNLTTSWAFAETLPERRRQGHGRRAAEAVLARLDPSRTDIMSQTYVPTAQRADHPYRRFAEALGLHVETTATVRELRLSAPVDVPGPTTGYAVETFVDGVPQGYRRELGELMGLVDVESPTGDIEWEPSPVRPEEYARDVDEHASAGGHVVEAVAVSGVGEVVAFTRLLLRDGTATIARQEGTLVRRDHRGHGLGLAVKAANLAALQRFFPDRTVVRTESDDANSWMVAINERLGFAPVETALILRLRRDT